MIIHHVCQRAKKSVCWLKVNRNIGVLRHAWGSAWCWLVLRCVIRSPSSCFVCCCAVEFPWGEGDDYPSHAHPAVAHWCHRPGRRAGPLLPTVPCGTLTSTDCHVAVYSFCLLSKCPLTGAFKEHPDKCCKFHRHKGHLCNASFWELLFVLNRISERMFAGWRPVLLKYLLQTPSITSVL